jgi:hypothetical protein
LILCLYFNDSIAKGSKDQADTEAAAFTVSRSERLE